MSNVKSKPPSAPALFHGLNVLETVSGSSEPVPFSSLLQGSGAARSTLIRLLRMLVDQDWLAKEKGGYVSGIRLQRLQMGSDLLQRLLQASEPFLTPLMEETGNTVGLFAVENNENIMIAKRMHPAAPSMREIGARETVSANSPWSWIIWKELTDEERQMWFAEEAGPPVESAWRSLEEKGWCIDDQVGLPLTCRMAAPLRAKRSGTLIGVLALAGNPLTMPAEAHDRIGSLLVQTADRIGEDV
jgi:DNA-binding IclR family transcriptional regulator